MIGLRSATRWLSVFLAVSILTTPAVVAQEEEQVNETTAMTPTKLVPLEECCAACPAGLLTDAVTTETERPLRILSYDAGLDLMGMEKAAKSYYEKTGTRIVFDLIEDFLGVYDEIRSQAESKLPLYDGYICGPAIVGSATQLDGWQDLTDVVRDTVDLKWLDVFRAFRENVAVYDNKVRMFPLDGDAHFMYYRADVLEAFGLDVPRTWEEYWQVAAAIHGKEFNNQTMVGSCVGRKLGGQTSYWISLVLASYTQTNGPTQGFILDSNDMEPLMGEAMAEALKMTELQAKYGDPTEFEYAGGGDLASININAMNYGYCALTYNWGDSYKVSHTLEPPSQVAGLMKVAPTPGTTKVYNRKTKKLDPCNEENCGGLGGLYYDDIGWVNRASYLAFGGWSAAVNNNIDDSQKQRIIDFFVYMCSPEISTQAAVPLANASRLEGNGVNPFRASHVDVQKWVDQGYERSSAESYRAAVVDTLSSPNAAYDMRFAGADLIFSALEEEVYSYLERAILLDNLPDDEDERHLTRMEVAEKLEMRFREIILLENDKPETLVPVLEQYQRDLGIYKPPSDDNKNEKILATVIPIVVAILVGAALLVYFLKPKSENDSVWQLKKEELIFADPEEIIGIGTFGQVLLAEYRGTQVAVKKVLPPRTPKKVNADEFVDEDKNNLERPETAAVVSGMSSISLDAMRSMASGLGEFSYNHNKLRQDFIKEMRHISKLRHPCITTVMGAVICPNEEPMLIMEYMEFGSLHDLLHNQSMILDGEIMLPMLRDITQGCRFLHAADPPVIHGDLKCANILVDSKFRAKVADFGLSQKKQMGATGTPFWMAPELLRQESANTVSSDVFSFGIMLYEVFSRKDPYEGEDAQEVLKKVADPKVHKRPPVPKECPPQLAALKCDCLCEDPEERPSFEELDKRLKRIDVETTAPGDKKDRTTVSLFDIFPKHIAEALRDGKQVEAEHKDVVTIFFSDIVGFTQLSSTMDPRKVAKMLDRLYQKLDTLSHEHDIFKVETIGDAYMAVTNLVKDQSTNHAIRIAEFAVDAIQAANETLIDEDAPEKGRVNIRVGFHSGSVVADVVGTRNPRYCLFGDTVNTASRMESNSLMNCIHCSNESAEILKEQNFKYPMVSRGKIKIKGKGEMHTWWCNQETAPPYR
ncbi:Ephrin type-B receptor 3 (Fragment) [Seminavis robusta]|uniref:Guanylate cyclase n=1 Tax=Seminavis robusta TaxID=568900 RepID=A0A9N8D815_9STRA